MSWELIRGQDSCHYLSLHLETHTGKDKYWALAIVYAHPVDPCFMGIDPYHNRVWHVTSEARTMMLEHLTGSAEGLLPDTSHHNSLLGFMVKDT